MKESLFWMAITCLCLACHQLHMAGVCLDEHFKKMMGEREELRDKEEVSIPINK